MSEAYAVLGDDRKRYVGRGYGMNISSLTHQLNSWRRAYDKTLVDDLHGPTSPRHPSHHFESHPYDVTRRKGATYAWQHQHPRHTAHAHPRHAHQAGAGGPYQRPHTDPGARFRDRDPFSSPYVQRATGKRDDAKRREHTEMDRVNNVSSFWRTVQVIGVVLFIAVVGGGFRADAG